MRKLGVHEHVGASEEMRKFGVHEHVGASEEMRKFGVHEKEDGNLYEGTARRTSKSKVTCVLVDFGICTVTGEFDSKKVIVNAKRLV
ncbi:hypothetical protein RRG08_056576 [Elysia crispata]|uniref:Uncharacterized protein n=1 Tax=Elysia crispata TaxID=231223 RepID=A0AAE1DTN3_9GAST|nr:hypothetical protein RRG08_056576 [Elysia crispata]